MGTCDTQMVTTFDWVVHFGCKLVQNDPRIEAVPMDAPATKSAAVWGACLAIFCSDVLPAWPGPPRFKQRANLTRHSVNEWNPLVRSTLKRATN